MSNHLSEDQITEWILGSSDGVVLRHLETCHTCSLQVEELRSTLAGFRDHVRATAQRDPGFWRNQELAFRDRVSASEWYPLHWAWVAAMVMVLITALFLTRTPNAPQNYASEDADNALLQAVQGDLKREVPEALAPAFLIAEERNEILASHAAGPTQSIPKKRR